MVKTSPASHKTLMWIMSREEPYEPIDASTKTAILSLFMFPLTRSNSPQVRPPAQSYKSPEPPVTRPYPRVNNCIIWQRCTYRKRR